jgi:hypothetical protein
MMHSQAALQPRTWLEELGFTAASLFRLAQLSMVFAPLLVWAPFALIYDIGTSSGFQTGSVALYAELARPLMHHAAVACNMAEFAWLPKVYPIVFVDIAAPNGSAHAFA